MKCAVIVISLIISGICLAAGDIANQLEITDGSSTKIQSCVAKVIEHILNPSESLAFVITSHPDYIPSRLPNPVTVVDIKAPLSTHYKTYEVNYVFEAESYALFMRTFDTILRSLLWHPMESPKGKFVILIKEEKALQIIFFKMWRKIRTLHIIVVIYEDTSKNCPMKIITSNPQAEGNNCARKPPTVFSNFSCDNLSLEFLKPIRNYNGCPVFIQPNRELIQFDFNMKGDRIMYNLLAGLKRALNVTPIFLFGDSDKMASELIRRDEIIMIELFFGKIHDWENSIIFLRKLFFWKGPMPIPISPLQKVFLPFKYDLWLAVLFITVLIVLVKWMIMKGNGYNNNIACAFTDIIGLTFGVSVNRIPNIWSLKLLLGFFLVYMIHIHTAYTSDLINILTVTRWGGVIKNVEEVGDSGLPIYMQDFFVRSYFGNVNDSGLLRKINKLIMPVSPKDYNNSINVTNHFIVCDEDDALVPNFETRFNTRYFHKIKFNSFLTSDISGEIKKIFLLENGSYFAVSLNAVITHLWESGTYETDPNLYPSLYNEVIKESAVSLNRFSQGKIFRPLSLRDLFAIFVILLILLSFSIIVFVAEIFVHKVVAQQSNQVVPLV